MSQKNRRELLSYPECEDCTHNDLFCDLSSEELDIISREKVENLYKKGQDVFYEGNRGHGLFCIYEGKVKLYKRGDNGKEQIVRLAKKGDVLGYRSLLGNEPYNVSASVIEDSVMCYVSKNKFLEVLKNNSNFSLKIIQLLTKDLRESEDRILNITQKTVLEKIAETLLVLKEKFGVNSDGRTLNVILSRREIGDIAGVTTETTIRTLSTLNKKKVLHLKGKQIELLDIPKLLDIANVVN